MEPDKLKQIIEAALLAADEPLTVDQLTKLFRSGEVDDETLRSDLRAALESLGAETEGRGYELKQVASGYRYQVRQELSTWISRLWEEKAPRYTRALLETLALVAYKQPVTRGDIEQVRGVSVSQSIMRTLLERSWIRVVGQREVPGRPAMYGTTREFLDYFDLKSLDQLPPLAEIRDLIEPLVVEEVLEEADAEPAAARTAEAAGGVAELGDTLASEGEETDVEREADVALVEELEEFRDSEPADFEAEVDAALAAADAITARINDQNLAAAEAVAADQAAEDLSEDDITADEASEAEAAGGAEAVDEPGGAAGDAPRQAQVVDVVTDLDVGEQEDEPEPQSAEVVRLPTAPH